MFKAQISDGEQIPCADYENGEFGVTLYGEDREFLAFVPYAHLLWIGRMDDADRTVW